MEIVKNYRDNKALRASFNALAEQTFGLNFEQWYQDGFWTDCYDPYSVVMDGEVVANVSVNRTDMILGGGRMRLLQLGTVMTKPEYRNRGLIRKLMEEIFRDYPQAEGIYLFGGDDVVEFYPKFGFRMGKEYLYTRRVEQNAEGDMTCVPMTERAAWNRLAEAMKLGEPLSACAMADNPGLIFFYVTGFMRQSVFYSPSLEAWAVAELEDGELTLHNVFCHANVTLEQVIRAFGPEVKQVTLGFAPAVTGDWEKRDYHEEDCTFFVQGAAFDGWAELGVRIPSLSHA